MLAPVKGRIVCLESFKKKKLHYYFVLVFFKVNDMKQFTKQERTGNNQEDWEEKKLDSTQSRSKSWILKKKQIFDVYSNH